MPLISVTVCFMRLSAPSDETVFYHLWAKFIFTSAYAWSHSKPFQQQNKAAKNCQYLFSCLLTSCL